MKSFARSAFSIMVYLHPRKFRTEFGEEMLWIFDEQVKDPAQATDRVELYVRLLFDVLCSAFIQHTLRRPLQPEAVGPLFGNIGSSSRVFHIAQGAFIVLSCLFNVASIALCLRMVMASR